MYNEKSTGNTTRAQYSLSAFKNILAFLVFVGESHVFQAVNNDVILGDFTS